MKNKSIVINNQNAIRTWIEFGYIHIEEVIEPFSGNTEWHRDGELTNPHVCISPENIHLVINELTKIKKEIFGE